MILIHDNSPAFDIANFESYCDSVTTESYRLDADYLVFGYAMSDKGKITIRKVWLKKMWELAGTSDRYPLKTQVKRDVIYNIRPNNQFKKDRVVPFRNKEQFLKAIYGTLEMYRPEKAKDWRKKVIENYKQFTGVTLIF